MTPCCPCPQVQRLDYLSCSYDPKWSLSLLEATVATLEELYLSCPGAEHLHKAHAAPRLRRLEVRFAYSLDAGPPVLPALAAPSCLQWLRVDQLPRTTLDSLLRAHAAALRTLWLTVGFPGDYTSRTALVDSVSLAPIIQPGSARETGNPSADSVSPALAGCQVRQR